MALTCGQVPSSMCIYTQYIYIYDVPFPCARTPAPFFIQTLQKLQHWKSSSGPTNLKLAQMGGVLKVEISDPFRCLKGNHTLAAFNRGCVSKNGPNATKWDLSWGGLPVLSPSFPPKKNEPQPSRVPTKPRPISRSPSHSGLGLRPSHRRNRCTWSENKDEKFGRGTTQRKQDVLQFEKKPHLAMALVSQNEKMKRNPGGSAVLKPEIGTKARETGHFQITLRSIHA